MRGQLQPRQVRATSAVKVNDHMLRQTLLLTCSEMQFLRRASGWMLSSSVGCSCRQHIDEACELAQPSGTVFFRLQANSETCTEMNKDLELMHAAQIPPFSLIVLHIFDCIGG